MKDITIIGAGPVGIFAAFQAGMFNLTCNIVDTLDIAGGQCTHLYPEKMIYDIPGHIKITGIELIKNLIEQARPFEPSYYLGQKVAKIKKISNNHFEIITSKETFQSRSILIATGAGSLEPNKIPLDIALELEGTNIFYSVQSIEKFRDKTVAIFGGGDSAIDWVLNLFGIAKKIYLIHRRDKFTAVPHNVDYIKDLADKNNMNAKENSLDEDAESFLHHSHKCENESNTNIEILTGYQLHNIERNDHNQDWINVIIQNIEEKSFKTIKLNCILPFYGLKKQTSDLSVVIEDKPYELTRLENKVFVNQFMRTNIDGIYAIGDANTYDAKLKLIMTGFAESAIACHDIYIKLHNQKPKQEYSTTKGVPSI